MLIPLVLTLLSAHCTLVAVISHIVLESSNGFVYIDFTDVPNPTSLSSKTNSGKGGSSSSGLNGTSALSTVSTSSHSTATKAILTVSDLSVSSPIHTLSASGLILGSSTSKNLGFSETSTPNAGAGLSARNTGTWTTSSLGSTSAFPTPTITGTFTTGSSIWPASITYVAESSSVPVVGVAFVTTINGISEITTTQPQQSLIPPTGSGYSLIAITEGGKTTTLTLNNLPTATLPTEPTGIQIVTESGIPVTYSAITLSGYNNTEPVEISTSFVETIGRTTTTQGGWWLIGVGGRIYPPEGRPWKTGSGVGCLAGPLFCRQSCVDIGLLEICPPGDGGGGGEIGPPGFPGGPVDGGGEPDDDPPPYEQPSPDEEPDQKTDVDQSATKEGKTASTAKPISKFASSTSSASATSGSVDQYFLVATPGADVAGINAFFGQIAPRSAGVYAPIFAANTVDGGFWTANLSLEGAASALSRDDISIIATYTNTPASYPTWAPSTVSDTGTVDLETIYASTLSPSETAAAKFRRKLSDEGSWSDSEPSYQDEAHKRSAEVRGKDQSRWREAARILKRDPGIRVVRQVLSPKDLSVLAWAPGVASVENVDFVFSERKGENTWVYVLDTGINALHREFRGNWNGQMGRFNIDPAVLRDPTTDWSNPVFEAFGTQGHGTCMASKVCGKKNGVAKQATVISVMHSESTESILSGLNLVLTDIISRQNNGQALPGKTVLSMSFGILAADINQKQRNYMQSLLKAIMNRGVICVCAAGNHAEDEGFPRTLFPAALASDAFPLIPVGAVDITGTVPSFSQEGIVYTVGVDSQCASFDSNLFDLDADGTSGGLIALKMSEPGPLGTSSIFGFGADQTQYQQLVKNYYTVGYNNRRPALGLHPPGSWYRPGSIAPVPVAWNGLDGSQSTVCPLIWAPDGIFKKRQATDQNTPSDICAGYTAHSIIIYSRAEKSCLDSKSICPFDYFLYSVSTPTGVPPNICNGDGFIGSVEEEGTSNSISFTLPTTTGDSANGKLNFVYTWGTDDNSGWVNGGSLIAPIACVAETSNSSLTEICTLEESNSKQKRAVGPINQPGIHPVEYVYAAFARCVWGSD